MPGLKPAIACFGAANIDRLARAKAPVVLATSNPVAVTTAPGGVARNIAESLARLGLSAALVSRVGSDPDGDRILDALTALGVDMAATTRSSGCATAGYTALVGPDGEMAVAMADMAIYDELTPVILKGVLKSFSRHAIWFADCNLPARSLALLRRSRPADTLLAVDTVSVAKAERLGPDLGGIDLMVCNRDEAAVLARRTGPDAELAEAILNQGAAAAIVSLGADGALIADSAGCRAEPALAATIRDVTGAGDALIAGTLFGLSEGRALADSVRIGLAAAALALESDWPVNETLSRATLLARAGLPELDRAPAVR